jgi:hypothetical protein
VNRRRGLLALATWVAAPALFAQTPPAPGAPAPAASTPGPAPSDLESLGGDRYRVGRIVVDKGARRLTVPGRVLQRDVPLEYLAVSPKGVKGYETLFELDASGSELNLACILLGLEADPRAVRGEFRRGTAIPGPRVEIQVAWSGAGAPQRLSAAAALMGADAAAAAVVEWVYTGSPASQWTGSFAADRTGSLISMIHDPRALIVAATPIGLGAYGSIRGNAALPSVGTPVELIIEAVKPAR